MSKMTLEFDMTEESTEAERAMKALDWYLLALDMQKWLRDHIKYGSALSEKERAILEEAQSYLYDAASDRNLSLE